MPRHRKTIDAEATRAKLDDAVATLQREAEGAEPDPFDDAMMAAVSGLMEAMKTEADALTEIEVRSAKLARRLR